MTLFALFFIWGVTGLAVHLVCLCPDAWVCQLTQVQHPPQGWRGSLSYPRGLSCDTLLISLIWVMATSLGGAGPGPGPLKF